PRETLFILFFEELVVQRTPPEARWQHFLQNADHVTPHQRHSFAGQFPEATDVAQMLRKAARLQRATTGAGLDYTVVIRLDIQHNLGRRGQQGGKVEGWHGVVSARHLAGILNERKSILEKVEIILIRRSATSKTNATRFHKSVGGEAT